MRRAGRVVSNLAQDLKAQSMPITTIQADTIHGVQLPELRVSHRTESVELIHVASPAARQPCMPHIVEATSGLVRALRLTLPSGISSS